MQASDYDCVKGFRCLCQFCEFFNSCGCNICDGYAQINCQDYVDWRKVEED